MKKALTFAALLALAASPALAGANGSVTGSYVEVRTAEVFTGGCIMGSEAGQMGKQAILAWLVDRGTYDGVDLAGLSVVAVVAGDRNLGMHEMGGEAPTVIKTAMLVDARATSAQRDALIAFAREMSHGLVNDVVAVQSVPVRFASNADAVKVDAGAAALAVTKRVEHDPGCGAMQWFHPFATVDDAMIGMADVHKYSGDALGAKWSDPGKRSAFWGTFNYSHAGTD